jgi:hypothetical protein
MNSGPLLLVSESVPALLGQWRAHGDAGEGL